ncbi:MAG TPA: Crp/Fnr family transcriptional regulator [Spirochaetes bacterium]|nr:Crp/Fnr family transcriptional regulator [Spirochaetota bacterium]
MGDSLFDKFGKTFKANQIIFCEHEPGDDFYLIQTGKVRLNKVVGTKEKTLDILGEGDIFGEMAILEEAPRSATAIAQEPVTALNFNKANFETLLVSDPQLAIKLLKIFSKRIYEAKRRLMILNFTESETRVVDTLLMLAEQKGISHDETEPVELDTNEEQIANWCAVKLDEARKIIKKYQNMGKINLKAGKVIIKNITELSRFVYNKRKVQYEENNQ